MMRTVSLLLALAIAAPVSVAFPQSASGTLQRGAKVFVHSMPNNFDAFFRAALGKKKVPVVIVEHLREAEFEIRGTSESQKANAAKKIFLGSWHSDEQASITVTSIGSGEVVFAYSVNKKDSAHGQRSTAEACAKHLKHAIERRK